MIGIISSTSRMEKFLTFVSLVVCSFLVTAWAGEDCYEQIGCFDNGAPFFDPINRPISWMPESRDQIGTTFRLNTRDHPDPKNYQELSTYDESTLLNSDFSPYRETKIITHGFTQGSSVDWMEDMMTEFLDHDDYNIIRVDWRKGALDLYGIATANTRIVGAEIAYMIKILRNNFGVQPSSFHIIGHSLGGHVAGYAGEEFTSPKIARITGLDPAGPYFENMDPIVRLDPTDATFVDVIHSDTDPIYTFGYGMYAPCGHMDFFPNAGREQPGCDQGLFEFIGSEGSIWDGTTQFVACNHLRSIVFFTESINSANPFLAFRCTRDHDDFNYGLCFDGGLAVEMGWRAQEGYPGGEGIIYQVNTNEDSPYCGFHYLFSFKMDDHRKSKDAKGQIFVTLIGYDAQSSKFVLTTETQEYYPDTLYSHMGLSDVDPGSLSGMYFEWDYDEDWYKWWDWEGIERPELFIHQIQITDVDGETVTMCGDYNGIEPDTVTHFYKTNTVCPSE